MKVVLSGYYGFDNVGDEAILYAIIRSIRELQPSTHITVLSVNPESTAKTYDVHAVNRWKLKDVSRVIKEADGLISGGGSLLQDQTGMKSIPYYTGIMRLASWHNKPVFIYAQGMGPINRSISKWIVRSTFKKVAGITVRDEDSKLLLETIGIKKEISVVPDPVLGLDITSFKSDWLTTQALTNPFLTVSVRDWPSEIPFKEQVATSLDKLAQQYTIVFLPMHGNDDAITSGQVADLMREKALIAPSGSSIEEKITIIGQSKLLIGMRLHALIFSSITSTPFVALSYDPKVDSFASIFDQPVVGHVTKNDWDSDSLVETVNESLTHEAERSTELKRQVAIQQSKALETTKKALALFAK